jgi:predicted transcriptional regulator
MEYSIAFKWLDANKKYGVTATQLMYKFNLLMATANKIFSEWQSQSNDSGITN